MPFSHRRWEILVTIKFYTRFSSSFGRWAHSPHLYCSCFQLQDCSIAGRGETENRRVARQFMDDVDIPWGHQVAAMFQIVCALALDVPEVLLEIGQLNGVAPNVTLACEPWGHMHHDNGSCECLSSDRTRAYVHELALATSFRETWYRRCGFFRPNRSSGRSWCGFFGLWRACTLGGHASGFGAIRVPSARCLQQAALGCVQVVADRSAGGVWLAEACYTWGLACGCTNHHGGVGWCQLTRILPM